MMINSPINSSGLPFFWNAAEQQRYRHSTCSDKQWGILAPRKHLLPWQVILPYKADSGSLAWSLIPVDPDGTSYVLPAFKLNLTCLDDGRSILDYDGSGIETVPDCGFYYLVVTLLPSAAIGCRLIYSEVLEVTDICGKDLPGLQLANCVDNGSDADFTITSDDTLENSLADESIQQLVSGVWTHLADAAAVVNVTPLDETPIQFRRVIQTECGYFKQDYTLTYDSADVCGTAALTADSI